MNQLLEIYDWMSRLGCVNESIGDKVVYMLNEADGRMDWLTRYLKTILNDPDDASIDYEIHDFRQTFGLHTNTGMQYFKTIAPIAYEECGFGTLEPDNNDIELLKLLVNCIKEDNSVEREKILKTPQTLTSLWAIYGKQIEVNERNRIDKSKGEVEESTNYRIIEIPDFATAQKWGQHTGPEGGDSALCYTLNEGTWKNYINKKGPNQCYIALRDDWAEVPAKKGEGYPKDSYGTSMIWFFVNPKKCSISWCNVRWNHGFGDFSNVDVMYDVNELSKEIHINLKSELGLKDFETRVRFAAIQLRNGAPFKDIFDTYSGYSICDGKNIRGVTLDGNYNFVDLDKRKILSPNMWFDKVGIHDYDGQIRVKKEDKWNFIDTSGKFLNRMGFHYWFDKAEDFSEGIASVAVGDSHFYIRTDGSILSTDSFVRCWPFRNGFGVVEYNYRYGYMGTNGEILGDKWFNGALNFDKKGIARVKIEDTDDNINKWRLFYKNGEIYPKEHGVRIIEKPSHMYDVFKDMFLSNEIYCLIYYGDNGKSYYNFTLSDGSLLFDGTPDCWGIGITPKDNEHLYIKVQRGDDVIIDSHGNVSKSR